MIKAVAGIIYNESGLMLVAERPLNKPYAGYWEFPGGKIEKAETSQQALQRELSEELGIHVVTAKLWLQNHHRYPDKFVQLDIWEVTDFIGVPQGLEGQKLAWVSASELGQLKILEGNIEIIKKLAQRFSGGTNTDL